MIAYALDVSSHADPALVLYHLVALHHFIRITRRAHLHLISLDHRLVVILHLIDLRKAASLHLGWAPYHLPIDHLFFRRQFVLAGGQSLCQKGEVLGDFYRAD